MKFRFPGDNPQIDWALGLIVAAVVIGWVWILLYGVQATALYQFFSIVGVSLTISGAALVSGGLLGFLFGVPRTLQQPYGEALSSEEDVEQGQERRRGSLILANTNLEQISDWLTKILVGVGLTQISKLPGALTSYANFVAPGLGDFPSSQVFAIGLLVYFVTSGFLLAFLWTRFYLTGALRLEEAKTLEDLTSKVGMVIEKVDKIQEQTTIDARALNVVSRHLNPAGDDKPLSQEDINAAILPASTSVRAQIFYQAQTQRSENWQRMEDKPKMERTIPIFRALIASDTENVYHANHGQLGFALKDQREPDWQAAEAELSKAIELRGPWEEQGWLFYEFNRAICRIQSDQNFQQDLPSNPEMQEKILADLQAAAKATEVKKIIQRDPTTSKWLDRNQVKLSDL